MTVSRNALDGKELAQYVDHTLLKPEALVSDFDKLYAEASEYGFYSVCIPPSQVRNAKERLKETSTKVCTVIGFPTGYSATSSKAHEVVQAIEDGADELDMVINIGELKSQQHERVQQDIAEVVDAAQGKLVKVIIECGLLTDEEKKIACELSVKAGAHYVKTSTGMLAGGATINDVKLMKSVVGDEAKVKASGGIRSLKDAIAFIEAGASRLGTSGGVSIINEIGGA